LETRCTPAVATVIDNQLMITGTRGNDELRVETDATNEILVVRDNGQSIGEFDLMSLSAVQIHGMDGNDRIELAGLIRIPVLIDGGAGNDVMIGGPTTAIEGSRMAGRPAPRAGVILMGGEGDDSLAGSNGNDILIGGVGSDSLAGNDGDDILIGGFTRFDNSPEVLFSMLNYWNSSDPYEVRVDTLRRGSDQFPSLGIASVFDDGAPDTFQGGFGQDWYFAFGKDLFLEKPRGEIVN
jgi:Ca2+-binding RTX toxin-like protein